jgi:hypothetical protein
MVRSISLCTKIDIYPITYIKCQISHWWNNITACQRGIWVIVWIDLGFNDLTEGHGTLQGGTNEHVIKKLYKKLKKEKDGAEHFLEVFWYTAKGLLKYIQNIFE